MIMNLHLSGDGCKALPMPLAMATGLIVSKRHRPTSHKPETFLLAILPDGQRKYISSLYPTTQAGQFRFDYLGHTYGLAYTESSAVSIWQT